jgi:hypothetical protein
MPEVFSSFFLTLSIVAAYLFVQIIIARVDRCRKSRRVGEGIDELNFYEWHIVRSKNYDVTITGQLLVINRDD